MTNGLYSADRRLFRVLATCGVFEPGFRGGGIVRGVARTVDTVSEHVDLVLVTRDRDLGSAEPYPRLSGCWIDRNRARVFYLNPAKLRQWLHLWRQLRTTPFDLLYANSLWASTTVIAVIAARLRLIHVERILLAPHGELSPGALSLKARKKQLFLKWWGPFLKSMNVVWHAHTDREAAEIVASCSWARVEVNHYQVTLPYEPLTAATPAEGPARLVFIGRISAKKNLELVLRTLTELPARIQLDIYGPLEDNAYWTKCQALIDRAPASVQIGYRGELLPEDVRHTFARYDAFVFPTLGENFAFVIAESLSASCPVICSDETPWTHVLQSGGGTVIPRLTTECLGREIQRIATMTPTQRLHAKQAAGRAYQTWRQSVHDPNILDKARLAPWTDRTAANGSEGG